MYKRLFIATALTIGLFSQPAWCMEKKDANLSEQSDEGSSGETEGSSCDETAGAKVFIQDGEMFIIGENETYNVELSDHITEEVKKIVFTGPDGGTCNIEGTNFEGLDKASPEELVISLKLANGYDWGNLKKAMRKYRKKNKRSPVVKYIPSIKGLETVMRFAYSVFWKDDPTKTFKI